MVVISVRPLDAIVVVSDGIYVCVCVCVANINVCPPYADVLAFDSK